MQRGPPPCENSRAVHISPHNPGTETDSEESSIKAIRKLATGFPTSHQPLSCTAPNSPKMGLKYPHLLFFAEISAFSHFTQLRFCCCFPLDLQKINVLTWNELTVQLFVILCLFLDAANNLCDPPHVSYFEFYNNAVDNLDLLAEYHTWQNPQAQDHLPRLLHCICHQSIGDLLYNGTCCCNFTHRSFRPRRSR